MSWCIKISWWSARVANRMPCVCRTVRECVASASAPSWTCIRSAMTMMSCIMREKIVGIIASLPYTPILSTMEVLSSKRRLISISPSKRAERSLLIVVLCWNSTRMWLMWPLPASSLSYALWTRKEGKAKKWMKSCRKSDGRRDGRSTRTSCQSRTWLPTRSILHVSRRKTTSNSSTSPK